MSPAAGETDEEGCLESQVDSRELIRERARQHGIEEASEESSQTDEIVQENRKLRAELVIIQSDLRVAREELMVARRELEHAQALVSPGGIVFWADTIGAGHIYRCLQTWTQVYGNFFRPSRFLEERARKGIRLV